MNQSSGKITLRHSRQKSSRSTDAKGERFFLQGKRWRLPRGLSLQETEARIMHLRKLWSDHERFCLCRVFVDPAVIADLPEFVMKTEAKRFLEQRTSAPETKCDSVTAAPPAAWTAFGSSGRSGGVTAGDETAQWSPLALWIAEQIKHGVQPVTLPPLPELPVPFFVITRLITDLVTSPACFRAPASRPINNYRIALAGCIRVAQPAKRSLSVRAMGYVTASYRGKSSVP